MPYRTPIVTGDRVALAPHTDLWMAGCRYGTVESIYMLRKVMTSDAPVYTVRLDTGRSVSLVADDLMGAVAGTPVGGWAVPVHSIKSDEPMLGTSTGETLAVHPDADLIVKMNPSLRENEYGFVCAEFDEDGSCIHSDHMSRAGL